jgi:dTDP-glucose 4,6-dehydratase
MNILVTGGLGFIGSHFIKHILAHPGDCGNDDYNIYNLDNMSYGSSAANLLGFDQNPRYVFVKGDINDITKIKEIQEIEAIINIAAETHVDRSISNPRPFIRSNYQGTFELLEYVRKNDIVKYVQISTDEVYGEAEPDQFFKESDPVNPGNPYSASKAAADLLVRSFCRTYGVNGAITRCTNNFGPNQFPEKLIPKTIIRILSDLPVFVYGNGEQVRDWLYVENHVKAICQVMRKGRRGDIYNISASNPMKNIDIINKVSSIVKQHTKKEANIKFTDDRPGHDKRYSLNSAKIEHEIGWRPETDFESALLQTVRWYLENGEWWKPLATAYGNAKPWKLDSREMTKS